jgi:hypothetical protein
MPLHAQEDTYVDPGAANLVARARAFRDAADSTILSYTGTVRSRIAAGLRMPLKDRTLYRREASARIRWSRDATSVVKVTSFREQTPDGITVPGIGNAPALDELFDPTQDRIYFGLTDDKQKRDDPIWIEHPLVPGAETHYRYQSGDTLSIRLQDGRTIRAIELRVLPRESSGHLVTGSLWIDPSNGTVVQALYRLARPFDILTEVVDEDDRDDVNKVPGILKPMTFDISMVAIEYSLFDFKYWMPRVTRLEGNFRAGMIRTPATYEISYDIDEVITATPETVAAEKAAADSITNTWSDSSYYTGVRRERGRAVRVLMPHDSMSLLTSPDLPEPVWNSNDRFMTGRELNDLYDRLDRVTAITQRDYLEPTFKWGFGAPGLVRYNRVEGLSVGGRLESQLPRLTLAATGRIGIADLHPNIELSAARPSRQRTWSLTLRHALVDVDATTDGFGLGNSASAILLGRDDSEYFRTTGATLGIGPSESARPSWDVTLFAQHDASADRETNITLRRTWDHNYKFRSNIDAASTELAGGTLTLRPWWGSDALGMQGGLDFMIEGAAGGYEFARTRLTARTAMSITHAYRIGLEAGAGTSTGDVPPQRLWYLGGAGTLRGYDGGTAAGTSFARARADVARTSGWGGVLLFADAGWAGEREAFDDADILYSVGAGTTLLDGLLRVDLAHALNTPKDRLLDPPGRWRLELYLDAIL